MVISRTPFRMSFFGGGTDYKEYYEKYGGSVISATFDKYCYVTVRDYPPFFEHRNQLTYSKIERFDSPSEIEHPLVRETMLFLDEDRLQISYDSDLPARTGIGSSSSFAVGLLNGIRSLRGHGCNAYTLAKDAIAIEREKCGEAGGVQDQIAVAFGGFNRIDFNSDGFYVRPLNIPACRLEELNSRLVLVFSGRSRFSSDIAAEQKTNIERNTAALNRMKQLVNDAQTLLESSKSLDEFGALLDETHTLKASLASNISTSVTDEIYEKAKKAGALGGKILGAGGGGFMLFYVPENKKNALISAFDGYMNVPFSFENEGSTIIYKN